MFPEHWSVFVAKNHLVGKEVEIDDEADHSGLGATINILDELEARAESEECYPGLVVVRDGFVPVGECAMGSGDPYFINTNDGSDGPLYRIYHDEVADENYDRMEAIVVVLKHYNELTQHEVG